jgi:sirohydrochlorin ferrochelatase
VVAHGASEAWNRPVLELARSVQTGGPVEVAFLMGPAAPSHELADAMRKLAAEGVSEIVVVPLLVSSSSEHYSQIRAMAGVPDSGASAVAARHDVAGMHDMSMAKPAGVRVPVVVTPALDGAPAVAEVLADRARALSSDPATQALFIIAHGPNSAERYAGWMRTLRPLADSVHASTGFHDVKIGLVRDDAPDDVRAEAVKRVREIITLQHEITGKPVIVVPLLVSSGSVARVHFVKDLEGLPVVYAGTPLLPHEALARWVERRVRDALRAPLTGSVASSILRVQSSPW